MAVTEVDGSAPTPATTASGSADKGGSPPAPTPRTPSTGFGKRIRDAIKSDGPTLTEAAREAASAPAPARPAPSDDKDSTPPPADNDSNTGSGTDNSDSAPTSTPASTSTESDAPAPASDAPAPAADGADAAPTPSAPEGAGAGPVSSEGAGPAPATNEEGAPAPTTSEFAVTLRTDEFESKRRDELAELETRRARLTTMAENGGEVLGLDLGKIADRQLETVDQDIDATRALAVMSEITYLTGGDSAMMSALDGVSEIPIEVRESEDMGSDAYYDADEELVAMSDDMTADVLEQADAAVAAGLLTEDYRINTDRIDDIDNATAINNIRKAADLVGGHEYVHAAQDQAGQLDEVNAHLTSEVEKLDASTEGLPENEAAAIRAEGFAELEMWRIDRAEYDAYMRQETGQISDEETRENVGFVEEELSGQTQAGVSTSVFLTVQPDGSLFERQVAVERIFNMEVYGTPEPTEEQLAAGYTMDPAAMTDAEVEGKRFPGKRFPGKRFPGEIIEEGTARGMIAFPEEIVLAAIGREESPGKRFPGKRFPGFVV